MDSRSIPKHIDQHVRLGDLTRRKLRHGVGGRVFVGSASFTVYSLDANTGCQYWSLRADAPVRAAITIGPGSGQGNWVAYVGDQRANVYAVDALTGQVLWKRLVDNFPGATITGAPILADGTLYVVTSSAEEVLGANPKYECCRFRGGVFALNAATGDVRCVRRRHGGNVLLAFSVDGR
jgi:polyvinyl alcohol dehydrogenase (cytochrome)